MKHGTSLAGLVCWAISSGQLPEDIARQIQASLDVFMKDDALFDSELLHGPAKQAELIIKLGFWLVKGQMKESEFRVWADCIPPVENGGWDVDLLHSEPGSSLQPVLKMGPICASPEACLVQEMSWSSAIS